MYLPQNDSIIDGTLNKKKIIYQLKHKLSIMDVKFVLLFIENQTKSK